MALRKKFSVSPIKMPVGPALLLTFMTIFAEENISETSCNPPCRAGYTCVNEQCIEICNPPCPESERCDKNGNCVSKQSSTPVSEAPSSAPANAMAGDTVASIRELRKNGVSLEIPWNGLVGIGALYTFRPISSMALDGGVGLSSMGLKYGVRGRYCFSDKNYSPFIGLGFMGASGADHVATVINDTKVGFNLKPTSFLQLSVGLDLVARNGFTLLIATGWAIPFNDGIENVTYDAMSEADYRNSYYYDPQVTDTFSKVNNLLYHGGLVLSLSGGYSF